MDGLLKDLRFALRTLRRSPGFTFAAVATLALGIGATTTIFSMVNAILLRPFPYAEPDRLIAVTEDNKVRGVERGDVDFPTFAEWRAQVPAFERLAAYSSRGFSLRVQNEAESRAGAEISYDMFTMLGIAPVIGRTFVEAEEKIGAPDVVLLGYGLWQTRFGGDRNIIGRTVTIDARPHTVVGVMAAGFRFPETADMWVPLVRDPAADRGHHYLSVIGRLRDGATFAQVEKQVAAVSNRRGMQYPEMKDWTSSVESLQASVVSGTRPMLLILLGAVGFVLLLVCANVASLMLARATAREREIAIRAAMGASRSRVVRQLMAESLIVALVGGAVGVLLSGWWLDAVLSSIPVAMPFWLHIDIDANVLAFTLVTSALTGVLFGLAPALQGARLGIFATLRDVGRGASAGVRSSRLRGVLVGAQVALALVLLVGGLLMIRSFLAMRSANPGFTTRDIVAMDIEIPEARYDDAKARQFFTGFQERMNTLPGVEQAALGSVFPISGDNRTSNFTIEGHAADEKTNAQHVVVTPAWFETMRIPVVRGRAFSEADNERSVLVAIINQTMANRFFPNTDPIGKRIHFGGPSNEANVDWYTIVGIAADIHQRDVNQKVIEPDLYRPLAQEPTRAMSLVVRSRTPADQLVKSIRRELQTFDPDVPLSNVKTIQQVLTEAVWDSKLFTKLFAVFAAVALIIAAVGLYGVIAYSVAQRTREIGIRMALGATRGSVVRLVLGQGMRVAGIGLAFGFIAAFALARVLAGALYGVTAYDPVTMVGVPLLLLAVTLLASFVPARRAAAVEPLTALRSE